MDITSDIEISQINVGQENASSPIRAALTPLQKSLIEYATISSRLLFIHDPCVFEEFHNSNPTFSDYSTIELCENMLNLILPNVHSYNLSDVIRKRLKLLDIHPSFRKTAQGYKYTPQVLGAQFELQPTIDFSLPEQLPKLLSAQLTHPRRSGASHTMVIDCNNRPMFELNIEIGALLSAFLSTDLELSSNGLLDQRTIKSRMQHAKLNFEKTANIMPYRNNLDLLTNNMATFEMIKKKLCSILHSI